VKLPNTLVLRQLLGLVSYLLSLFDIIGIYF